MKFNLYYFIAAILLVVAEICIALFVQDQFIRPYVGDFLVVILIYCCLKSFFDIHYLPAAMAVLLFSFLIEFLQFMDLVRFLGLENNEIASTVIGSSFSWADIVAYCFGIGTVIVIERLRASR